MMRVATAVIACLVGQGVGNFLDKRAAVEGALFNALANDAKKPRLEGIQEQLRSTYQALPKNEYGRLESPSVRYTLHRYFAQNYGWSMKGLEPAGGGWNASSPTAMMQGQVPAYLHSLLETQVNQHGLSLEGLATFVLVLTDLVNQEAISQLGRMYDLIGLSHTELLPADKVDEAVRAFLILYIQGNDEDYSSYTHLVHLHNELFRMTPSYPDHLMWVQDLRHNFEFAQRSSRNPFKGEGLSFEDASDIIVGMIQNFGHEAHKECIDLKNKLLDLEYKGTGRVPLPAFYSSSSFPLHESAAYLRNLGVLDETDMDRPSIVIPSYLTSQTNCITDATYYATCCLDECESLLDHIEQKVGAPFSTPADIAKIVSALPSDTVDAPRNLSAPLLGRLSEIAGIHHGRVPMHGRLFMQWMHHAYPRECAFPHEADSFRPLSQDEWMEVMSVSDVLVSEEERQMHLNRPRHDLGDSMSPEEKLAQLPWTMAEELVSVHKDAQAVSPWDAVRAVMGVAALSATVLSLMPATKEVAGGAEKIHSI